MSQQVQNQTTLRCVINPSDTELWAWWETMQADVAGRQWFSDAFPATYADFVTVLSSGAERGILFFDGDQVAGGYWLHDMVDDDPDYPPYAWVRAYVSPTYRGHFTVEAWPIARAIFEQWGYWHLFAATHVDNKRALASMAKYMQFTLIGPCPHFCLFNGVPGTCIVGTIRPEDSGLAMRDATLRSERLVAA